MLLSSSTQHGCYTQRRLLREALCPGPDRPLADALLLAFQHMLQNKEDSSDNQVPLAILSLSRVWTTGRGGEEQGTV